MEEPAAEGETTPPRIIDRPEAKYTDSALAKGIEGTVGLTAVVRRDGSVGGVAVTKSLEESLDLRALRAVRRYKFEPATRDGKPVNVVVEINVDFKLPKKQP
jgi:protein TonB